MDYSSDEVLAKELWETALEAIGTTEIDAACASSLCDPEPTEHGDFGKVQDECKDDCRDEYCSHNEYRQRSHRDSASRQR